MKVVSRYCDSCGVKIPATDIEDEIALKYEDSYYCKECKADILPLIDKKGGGNGSSGKGVAKAARAGAEATRSESKGDAPEKKAAPKTTSGQRPAVGGAAPKTTSGQRPAVGAAAGKSSAAATPSKGGATSKTPVKALPAGKPGAAAATKKPIAKRPPQEEEESEEDLDAVGSEEEMDAEPAPKSKKLLFIGIGAVAVIAIVGLALAFGGGNKGAAGGSTASSTGAPRGNSEREKSERIWRDALAAVKDKPIGERVKALQLVYDSDAFSDGDVATKALAELDELKDQYAAKGKEEFERINAKAKSQAEGEQYLEAIDTFRGFADDLRGTAWYTSNVRSEIGKLEVLLQAKNEAEPLMKKADEYARNKEYMLAAGVLDGFDMDEYSKSPWKDKIAKRKQGFEELASASEQSEVMADLEKAEQARIAAEAAERKKKQDEEDKRIASMSWTQLPTDDLFTWKVPEPTKDCWKTSGQELTGKCGAALSGASFGAIAGCGDKRWQDYIFEVKYKIVKGGFHIGVRSNGSAFCELTPDLIADGAFHTIQISVRGDGDDSFQEIKSDGSKVKIKFDAHDSSQGGICFTLSPNSECVFTGIRCKVIAKLNN